MVMVPVRAKEKMITAEELYCLPDLGRCELVEGRIEPKTLTGDEHGAVELNIAAPLKAYADKNNRGKVRVGEVGIYIKRDPDTVRAADVLYISKKRYDKRTLHGYLDVSPELVVEVLSPEDRWTSVTEKLADYFKVGVTTVWLADPKTRSIFAYRSLTDVRQFKEGDTLSAEDLLPGFSLPVEDAFRY
jgi:Uma2 family endonuclease